MINCLKHLRVYLLVHLHQNQTRKFIYNFLSQNVLIPPNTYYQHTLLQLFNKNWIYFFFLIFWPSRQKALFIQSRSFNRPANTFKRVLKEVVFSVKDSCIPRSTNSRLQLGECLRSYILFATRCKMIRAWLEQNLT